MTEWSDIDVGFSFSHPTADPGLRQRIQHYILAQHARLKTGIFLRRRGAELATMSEGLAELLGAWQSMEPTAQETIGYPLSLPSYRAADLDAGWMAAQGACHLAWAGREGGWRVRFRGPHRLTIGPLITPAITALELEAAAGMLRLRILIPEQGWSALNLPCQQADAAPEGWSRAPEILCPGHSSMLMLDTLSRPCWLLEQDELGDPLEPAEEQLGCLDAALKLLHQQASSEYQWVVQGIRAVIPMAMPAKASAYSWSTTNSHGNVHIALAVPTLRLTDILVHEAAHQFFHLGQLTTLFTNGRDSSSYWSPFVAQERPLLMLLLGFHAFANATLLYQRLQASGPIQDRLFLTHEIEKNLQDLEPIWKLLDQSPGLSDSGRALYEPLRELLYR